MTFAALVLAGLLLLGQTRPEAGIVLVGQAQPGEDAAVRLRSVGVPYYYDYTATFDAPAGYTKVLMVRLGRDTPEQAADLARAHPGQHWLVGNEPDQPDQDASADGLLDLMLAMKDADPTATLIGPNILSTSSLEPYRDLPFDIWGVHVYEDQPPLEDWPHPLWVTEFGSGSTDPLGWVCQAIRTFEQYGVETWFLFSSDPIPQAWGRSSGNWITTFARDGHGNLTDVGRAYRKDCQ